MIGRLKIVFFFVLIDQRSIPAMVCDARCEQGQDSGEVRPGSCPSRSGRPIVDGGPSFKIHIRVNCVRRGPEG